MARERGVKEGGEEGEGERVGWGRVRNCGKEKGGKTEWRLFVGKEMRGRREERRKGKRKRGKGRRELEERWESEGERRGMSMRMEGGRKEEERKK